jgi:hypothetical protein
MQTDGQTRNVKLSVSHQRKSAPASNTCPSSAVLSNLKEIAQNLKECEVIRREH